MLLEYNDVVEGYGAVKFAISILLYYTFGLYIVSSTA